MLRPGAQKTPAGAQTLAELLDLASELPKSSNIPDFLATPLLRLIKLTGGDCAACYDTTDLSRCLGASTSGISASRTLLRRAVESQAPVIGIARGGGTDPAARSLVLSRVEAAMAAPMSSGSASAGAVLYVERGKGVPSGNELSLLGAVAQLASGAFAACERRARMEEENLRLRSTGLATQMVGRSGRMQEVLPFITRVSRADSTF